MSNTDTCDNDINRYSSAGAELTGNDYELREGNSILGKHLKLEFDEDIFSILPGYSSEIKNIVNNILIKSNIKSFDEINDDTKKIASDLAASLLFSGHARDFVFETWQKRYYGNPGFGKAMLLSYACGKCNNTKGLFVIAIGPAGYGKSFGFKSMLEFIPDAYEGTESDKARFHDDKTSQGSIKYRDEIKFDDDLKLAWTYFQTGESRKTTVGNLDDGFHVEENKSKGRITIWGSTVDFNADEQIKNRFLQIEVKSDAETLKNIHERNNKMAAGIYQTPVEEKIETAICKQIFMLLKNLNYNVIIPYAERIEYGNTDPRTATMFRDAIRASAIWDHLQNRDMDKFGRLEANEADFYTALDMFKSIGGQSTNKFTERETDILQAIINNGYRASFPEIQKAIGMSGPRFTEILHGRNNREQQQKYGLLSKCDSLILYNDKRPYILELDKKFVLNRELNIKLK